MITKEDVVYISGPMTGYIDFNIPLFNMVAESIWALYGCRIVNPADLPDGLTWTEYLVLNLENMRAEGATVLYQLPFWQDSRGACIEHDVAIMSGLMVLPCA